MKKKEKDIITLYGILYERLPVTDILRFVIVGLLVYVIAKVKEETSTVQDSFFPYRITKRL